MRFVREEPITVLRLGAPTLDLETGRYSDPIVEEVIIQGSIQPVSGEDLVKVPEGYRAEDMKMLFAHVELEELDKVLFKNKTYRVEGKDDWDVISAPLRHYKYVLLKENLL